ncbi:beta-N-acetylhexosaminidase [Hyphomicrobium methylovorum]|uniref:beta-N-acetylhexosaminidase n=1 Tax=Hyphomicrobium methylovorum TaxID=84 RepID=UPI0015E6C14D|nr:beta-N-acetylhexosaminidase [Hyphomicrobium methylovorum]MBA2127530.1 beta-N-acetylhexosaminidase [Hyphomicrobium methylovorum]
MTAAFIAGVSGTSLTDDERRFFAETQPAGFIIFTRNVESREQLARLTSDVRAAVGRDDFLVLIDQEGGRVQRLRPPISRLLPPAAAYADCYRTDPSYAIGAAHAVARLTGEELREFGINMNCAPVVDLPVEGAHEIISDRAYGQDVAQVVALARAVGEGLMAAGVVPVIKHIPGHGRATADSHFALPVVSTPHEVLSKTDFAPFKELAAMPSAMTAHVVYSAIDADAPASTSKVMTERIIRGEIGFDGLLMSDDLSMKALKGPMRARAEAVIAAGSDVALHCNGDLDEMRAVAAGVPQLSGRAQKRFAAAIACTQAGEACDRAAALDLLAEVQVRRTRIG